MFTECSIEGPHLVVILCTNLELLVILVNSFDVNSHHLKIKPKGYRLQLIGAVMKRLCTTKWCRDLPSRKLFLTLHLKEFLMKILAGPFRRFSTRVAKCTRKFH